MPNQAPTYIHIPFSIPSKLLSEICNQTEEHPSPCAYTKNQPRWREIAGEAPPASDPPYYTIICDPAERLSRIFRLSTHNTWDEFMDCQECRWKWVLGHDYHVGASDNQKLPDVENIPIENLTRISGILGRDVTPFLEPQNSNTKPTPSWAKHLVYQHHPEQARLYGYDSTPASCMDAEKKSIIIVGSNRCLHGSGLGKIIDSYDVVVRCSNAPREDHEADVGSRLDVAMLNAVFTQHAPEHPSPRSLPHIDPDENVEVWHPPYRAVRGIYKHRMGYFPVLLTDTLYETAWKQLGAAPSSGLLSVMAAANFGFQKISIAGFGPLEDNDTFSHYYGDVDKQASQCNFVGENQLLRDWLGHGLIDSLDEPWR